MENNQNAIILTSAMNNAEVCVDVNDVAGVLDVSKDDKGNANAKVFTRTCGNLYVNEDAVAIRDKCFVERLKIK